MSNYNSVKATINANIKANNNQEITGDILNSVLIEMVDSLAAGYIFKGVATPSTNPGSPDEKVFYLAPPGTYANFGGSRVVPVGYMGVLKYDSSWSLDTIEVGKDYDSDIEQMQEDIADLQEELLGGDVVLDLSSASSVNRLTINTSNLWAYANNVKSSFYPISQAGDYKIEAISGLCIYAILNSTTYSDGGTPDFATGFSQRYSVTAGSSVTVTLPAGTFLWYRSENTSAGGAYVPRVTLLLDSDPLLRQSSIADNLESDDPEMVLSARQGKILSTMDIDANRVKIGASGTATIGGKTTGNARYVGNNDFRYPNYPPVGYHITKIHASANASVTATIGIYTPGVGISGQTSFNLVNGDVTTDVDITVPVGSYLCIGNAIGLRFTETNTYGSYNITSGQSSAADLSLWFEVEITSIGLTDYVEKEVNSYRPHSLLQIFPKVTTIGDSLMAGYTHQGSTLINSATARAAGNNWPTYLCKRNGLEVNNLAIGSSTAHHWRYADGPSAGNIADITAANIPTDCYYVGIGVNDLRNSVPIGTSADIAADQANNADSFYGNYDYIVRQCHSYNAKAHIFAFTIPTSEVGNAAYNVAIKYVSDLYSYVHCLDLSTVADFTEGVIAGCFANGHYDPLAYNLISTIIETLTNDYIYSNPSEFIIAPY